MASPRVPQKGQNDLEMDSPCTGAAKDDPTTGASSTRDAMGTPGTSSTRSTSRANSGPTVGLSYTGAAKGTSTGSPKRKKSQTFNPHDGPTYGTGISRNETQHDVYNMWGQQEAQTSTSCTRLNTCLFACIVALLKSLLYIFDTIISLPFGVAYMAWRLCTLLPCFHNYYSPTFKTKKKYLIQLLAFSGGLFSLWVWYVVYIHNTKNFYIQLAYYMAGLVAGCVFIGSFFTLFSKISDKCKSKRLSLPQTI